MANPVIVAGVPDPAAADFPFETLARIARDMSARVVLAHAVESPTRPVAARTGVVAVAPFRSQAMYEEAVTERVQQLSRLAERLRADGVEIATWAQRADPVPALLDLAQAERAALVAVAAHGHLGPRLRPLGSVAAELVKRSSVPVLVLPW